MSPMCSKCLFLIMFATYLQSSLSIKMYCAGGGGCSNAGLCWEFCGDEGFWANILPGGNFLSQYLPLRRWCYTRPSVTSITSKESGNKTLAKSCKEDEECKCQPCASNCAFNPSLTDIEASWTVVLNSTHRWRKRREKDWWCAFECSSVLHSPECKNTPFALLQRRHKTRLATAGGWLSL